MPRSPRLRHSERTVVTFAATDEQLELSSVVRQFLEDKAPLAQARRLMETADGLDSAVWDQMASQLGLQGLHIPEAYGGMGFSFAELGLVLEEMGRALLCAPYFSCVVLAASAVLAAGTPEQRQELLPPIAAGQLRATLAVAEGGDVWDPASITAQARPDRGACRLHGTKTLVIDGHTAQTVIVAARAPGSAGAAGVGLFAVDGAAGGLTRTPLPALDQTRKLARLDFDGTPALRLGDTDTDTGWPALLRTLRQAAVCLAAEQVGGAQRCLEMAVGYAKTRTQFGRPIGGFQVIKHRCADLLLAVETARSAALYAIEAAAADSAELPMAASLALAHCSEVFSRAASENIQIHGGIGFTWEHDAHLFLKRAKSSEYLLGSVSRHREAVAELMGL
jgi:alkylation response protein AidB-like acyl-CoA dehydrogenase